MPVQKNTTARQNVEPASMTMTLIVLLSLHHTAYIYIFLRTRERTLLLNMINGLKFELEGKEYNQFTKLQTSFHFHWDLGEVKFYLILGDQKRKSQTGMAFGSPFPFPIPIPIWTDMHARD